ncbi:MAG: rod shape-determining protein RodA [Bacteroidia bacterium]|nr:rod shape-determining protein RodA [Bacteroidia bacterium]
MNTGRFQRNTWQNSDKVTIYLYVALVILGWLNVYAAVYNENHPWIFDISQKYGKQFLWIAGAGIIAFSIMLMDTVIFTSFSYAIFVGMLLLNVAVIFLGKDIKGSHSWFRVGGMGIQPSEFMKFAILLAISKYLSENPIPIYTPANKGRLKSFWLKWKSLIVCTLFVIVPFVVVKIFQNETGVALTYFSIMLLLYREGAPSWTIVAGFVLVIVFFLSIMMGSKLWLLAVMAVPALIFFLIFPAKMSVRIFYSMLIWLALSGTSLLIQKIYDKLEPHQKNRIEVLLGRSKDVKGVGYNVNQSKIAIGSGGFWGKGYLKGTQTKYDFVPEQETDFIFCTVGEEWGFAGSSLVVAMYIFLIIRLIFLAERQRSSFSRIYGYGVACIFFIHVLVNIGMALGIMPVIGIPLPFFSYGGSSLWGFTVLLFIFIRLDAERLFILR